MRRTNSKFNKVVLRRLHYSNQNRFPISLSRLINNAKQDKTIVTVGTVTNDERVLNIPKLSVCALRFTETARKRILAAGGEVLTFD